MFTSEVQGKMNSLQQDIIKNKGAMFREELFKILDYNSAIQRAHEAGRQEGLKGKQFRQQANLPQGTTTQTTPLIYEKTDTKEEKLRKSAEAAEKQTGMSWSDIGGHYLSPKR